MRWIKLKTAIVLGMLLCVCGTHAQEETDTAAREQDGRLYSGYFNTSNAVTSAYGNNQAGLTYFDP